MLRCFFPIERICGLLEEYSFLISSFVFFIILALNPPHKPLFELTVTKKNVF